jgi:ribonuclease HII
VRNILIGIDEAGMGTLAGPMTAAAVIIDEDRIPKGVKDSKQIREIKREELASKVMDNAIAYKIVVKTVKEVNDLGISPCWQNAMLELAKFVDDVNRKENFKSSIIMDGNRFIVGAPYVTPVIKADVSHAAVSAASILAKYMQCGWMDDYDVQYPQYNFKFNRGYGTNQHLRILRKIGPCIAHRVGYQPIKKLLLKFPSLLQNVQF